MVGEALGVVDARFDGVALGSSKRPRATYAAMALAAARACSSTHATGATQPAIRSWIAAEYAGMGGLTTPQSREWKALGRALAKLSAAADPDAPLQRQGQRYRPRHITSGRSGRESAGAPAKRSRTGSRTPPAAAAAAAAPRPDGFWLQSSQGPPPPAIRMSSGAAAPHPGAHFSSHAAGVQAVGRHPAMDLGLLAGSTTLRFRLVRPGDPHLRAQLWCGMRLLPLPWPAIVTSPTTHLHVRARGWSCGCSPGVRASLRRGSRAATLGPEYWAQSGEFSGEPAVPAGQLVALSRLVDEVSVGWPPPPPPPACPRLYA
eukprot:COSAG01_NODE_3527_length_5971_cov_2.572377_4_plen_317_part_00